MSKLVPGQVNQSSLNQVIVQVIRMVNVSFSQGRWWKDVHGLLNLLLSEGLRCWTEQQWVCPQEPKIWTTQSPGVVHWFHFSSALVCCGSLLCFLFHCVCVCVCVYVCVSAPPPTHMLTTSSLEIVSDSQDKYQLQKTPFCFHHYHHHHHHPHVEEQTEVSAVNCQLSVFTWLLFSWVVCVTVVCLCSLFVFILNGYE